MQQNQDADGDVAAALIDKLAAHQRVLNAAQARLAELMIDFADRRKDLDRRRIAELSLGGGPKRYAAGEFAAVEVALATTTPKQTVARLMAVAARLQLDAPAVWTAWSAGDIDQARAFVIDKALRRLAREDSRRLLNQAVVPVASCRTVDVLRRWLTQFVARVEPNGTDARMKRAFEDRYVSIRPHVDGMSFLNAGLAAIDSAAIDQVLDSLAGRADPSDPRTVTQRRADALVDVVLGRVSNGCHVTRVADEESAPAASAHTLGQHRGRHFHPVAPRVQQRPGPACGSLRARPGRADP